MTPMYIAIDIGGTKIHLAKFESTETATPIKENTFPTPEKYKDAVKEIVKQINALVDEKEKILGIGISSTGFIENKMITKTELLADWLNKPISNDISQKTGAKNIKIMNDAACSALGEFYFGGTPRTKNFLYLIVGTGFGGSFLNVTNGNPVVIPMEPGYMVVPTRYKNKTPTSHQMLQLLVGGKFLSKQIKQDLEKIDDNHLIWDQTAEYLALTINNISALLTPEKVILAGGLIQKRSFLVEKITKNLNQYEETIQLMPTVYLSEIKTNVSLLGALALLKN